MVIINLKGRIKMNSNKQYTYREMKVLLKQKTKNELIAIIFKLLNHIDELEKKGVSNESKSNSTNNSNASEPTSSSSGDSEPKSK